jgi:TIR domain
MPRIFISYRRDDTMVITERIHDRLVQEFTLENVILDVDSNIPDGTDFRQFLRESISQCDVMLIIIGRNWLDIREDTNPDRRRLDNPEDIVRMEVRMGLERQANDGIKVIPLLVAGAEIPTAEELPEPLRQLSYLQARMVRGNPDFHKDMSGLIKGILPDDSNPDFYKDMAASIEGIPPDDPVRPEKSPFNLGKLLAIAVLLLIGTLLIIFGISGSQPNPVPTSISAIVNNVPTLDAQTAARETYDANLTLTAESWTPTPSSTSTPTLTLVPTIDLTATANAEGTRIAIIDLTWTAEAVASRVAAGGVTRNQDWVTTVVQSINGVDMVLVPAGCFDMGSSDEQIDYAMTLFSRNGRVHSGIGARRGRLKSKTGLCSYAPG